MTRGWVLYDGACGFCRRWIPFWGATLRNREFEIAPGQRDSRWYDQPVEAGHAVAWNPSLPGGGKSEDTFLVEEDGLRCVTRTGSWPEVDGRPAVLELV